mmetsp:Transcript_32268/g.65922  ORF Transcript_32268/g.65922 Transcript_32268/m.65922 type:complete len:111 (+) Transcript_32268:670-1002(+)
MDLLLDFPFDADWLLSYTSESTRLARGWLGHRMPTYLGEFDPSGVSSLVGFSTRAKEGRMGATETSAASAVLFEIFGPPSSMDPSLPDDDEVLPALLPAEGGCLLNFTGA